MKKIIIAFAALFMITVSARSMGYEQARNQALFLTDKMAYELNLTEDQYEAAYEINLDYLMGVNTVDDLYGVYWRQRNLDLSYILLDWQYSNFCAATYFYRPLYWDAGYWHFGIYARYPYRNYFFFGEPRFYAVYRGGHSWRCNGGRSWYHGRRDWGRPRGGHGKDWGMRDSFNRGDYRNGYTRGRDGRMSFGNGGINRNNNNTRNGSFGRDRSNSSFGTSRANGSFGRATASTGYGRTASRGTFGGSRQANTTYGTATSRPNYQSQQNRTVSRESSTRTTVTRGATGNSSFGGSRNYSSTPRQSFSRPTTTSERSNFSGNRSYGSFGSASQRSTSSFSGNRSFSSPSRSAGSFGGGHSSFSGGSRGGSFGGGASRGGSFGGHR